jgi:uncharacterized 2Fe-2S/4Fe-4S cluster protein (DUF4445 family)
MNPSHPDPEAAQVQVCLPGSTWTLAFVPAEHPTLAQALEAAGEPLNQRCGGRGLCRGCTVHLEAGSARLRSGETISAGNELKTCQTVCLEGPAPCIRIPEQARLAARPQIIDTFLLAVPHAHAPLFPPTPTRSLALAIDIGTTTVVVSLVDLTTGGVLATASALNAQASLGADVVARMQACLDAPGAVARLRNLLVERSLAPLIGQVLRTARTQTRQLAGAVLAGNTTMLHLALGRDPSPMANVPFEPAFLDTQRRTAGEAGWTAIEAPDLPLVTLPCLGPYVGGDLAAGIAATGLRYADRPTLLIDVGTNGEMILWTGEQLLASATAAGPAFEGGDLSCGTRAVHGALASLSRRPGEDGLQPTVIGAIPPGRANGICGSAYIDLLALGREAGWLDVRGRFSAEAPVDPDGALVLVTGNRHTRVTETDIALLLQAKAAIAGGAATLLSAAGLEASAIDRLWLAGGFGFHLNRRHALACGLLPPIGVDRIEVCGNAALGGAYLGLMDAGLLEEMGRLREACTYIELNHQPDFEDHFIDALGLGPLD